MNRRTHSATSVPISQRVVLLVFIAIFRIFRPVFGSAMNEVAGKCSCWCEVRLSQEGLKLAEQFAASFLSSWGGSRPQPDARGYVSISAGGAPDDRIEWPVFGEQIDDLTAATWPQTVAQEIVPLQTFVRQAVQPLVGLIFCMVRGTMLACMLFFYAIVSLHNCR